uniref:Putative secreted peptide n=1 Tax=Anopheles braziliensis TaxID=58242 RepID=A0A2M3ZV24_9DIPT
MSTTLQPARRILSLYSLSLILVNMIMVRLLAARVDRLDASLAEPLFELLYPLSISPNRIEEDFPPFGTELSTLLRTLLVHVVSLSSLYRGLLAF